MVRNLFFALGAAALLAATSPASAQIIGGIGGLQGLQKAQNLQLQKMAQTQRDMLKGLLDPELMKQLQLPLDPEGLKKLQLDPEMLKKLQADPNFQLPKGQPGGGLGGQLQWAGMKLKRPAAADAQNLGLPEGEGQQIISVAAASAGETAGLKANDIIVKINDKPVPSDHAAFAKFIKDTDANAAMNIIVIREGKEEKINGAKMPLAVQSIGNGLNGGGAAGIIRINGLLLKGLNPRIGGLPKVNPNPNPNPNPPAPKPAIIPNNVKSSQTITVNGAKITRKQDNELFSGTYAKDDLNIAIAGKIENGAAKATEITITEGGKDAKKYTTIHDVPGQYRTMIQMLMPRAGDANFPFPMPFDPKKEDF